MFHQAQAAIHAFIDGKIIEAGRFTALEYQNGFPFFAGLLAQGIIPERGIDDQRRREFFSKIEVGLVAEYTAQLRIVVDLRAARMKVDAEIDLGNDLIHQVIGDPSAKRAILRSREAAVKVPSIREIARA